MTTVAWTSLSTVVKSYLKHSPNEREEFLAQISAERADLVDDIVSGVVVVTGAPRSVRLPSPRSTTPPKFTPKKTTTTVEEKDDVVACPSCDALNDADAKRCDQCGSPMKEGEDKRANGEAALALLREQGIDPTMHGSGTRTVGRPKIVGEVGSFDSMMILPAPSNNFQLPAAKILGKEGAR